MSSTATTSVRAILKGPDDWIPWLEMVKSTATTGQVWEYVDPSRSAEIIPKLVEPQWPEPSDLPLTDAERAGTITAAHKEELSELRSLYKIRLNRYDQRKASIASLHRFIQETVHPDRIHYTFNCDSVHQMLVNLQQRLKPKDDVRRYQLIDQYRGLQESPTHENLDSWMTNWEKVYREGVKLQQPIVQKDTAVQDFLRAVFDIAPDFASFWTNTIQSSTEDAKPDLYTIIDRFRVQRQILHTETGKPSQSAFSTTLQGQQQQEIQQETRTKKSCICGLRHLYPNCYYLDDSRAPAGWKEDPAIRKIVQEQLEKPEIKQAVERAFQRKKGTTNQDQDQRKEVNSVFQSFDQAF